MMKGIVGVETFTKNYAGVQQDVFTKREERKRQKAVNVSLICKWIISKTLDNKEIKVMTQLKSSTTTQGYQENVHNFKPEADIDSFLWL